MHRVIANGLLQGLACRAYLCSVAIIWCPYISQPNYSMDDYLLTLAPQPSTAAALLFHTLHTNHYPYSYTTMHCLRRTIIQPIHWSRRFGSISTSSSSITLYSCPDSILVKSVAWLIAIKGTLAGAAGIYLLWRETGHVLNDQLQSSATPARRVASTSSFTTPVLLCGISAFTLYQLRRGLSRVVTQIEQFPAQPPSQPQAWLGLQTMTLWGKSPRIVCLREDCLGAKPNTLTHQFTVVNAELGSRTMYLLPTEAWHTDDKAELHKLLYQHYFRPDDRAPPKARDLIFIEGLKAYRPVQHIAQSEQQWPLTTSQIQALSDSDPHLFIQNGYIYKPFEKSAKLPEISHSDNDRAIASGDTT